MIYRLEFENFYCFRDRQVLNLAVPQTVPPDDEGRLAPIFYGSNIRAPKVAAIFGANGSGKSTVLRVLTFMRWFITESHTRPGLPDICLPFNDAASLDRPTRLAVETGDIMILNEQAAEMAAKDSSSVPHGVYRYEVIFKTDSAGTRKVFSEALKQRTAGQGKWKRVFERNAQGWVIGSKNFNLSGYAKIINKIRDDASLIPMLASFGHEPSQALLNSVRDYICSNILLDKFELDVDILVKMLGSDPELLEELNVKIQKIDTGVQRITIEQGLDGPIALFEHEGLHRKMPWPWESTGTQSFIRIFPYLYEPILRGGLAIIDELDSAIHPAILLEVLDWYYNTSRKADEAQLWMTCQNPSLLDNLTKEEIIFCEKRPDGSSEVFSLADIKTVRRDDNFYKKYLSGNYGAIPHIG